MQNFYLRRALMTLVLGLGSLSLLYGSRIVVTSTLDDDSEGTLRQAIDLASSGDTILFAASTNGTPITLEEVIIIQQKNLRIRGNGMNETILSGDNSTRVFSIRNQANVVIERLTVRDGSAAIGGGVRVRTSATLLMRNARVINCTATGNRAGDGGGGLANGGTLRLRRVLVDGNAATGASEGSGGGILNVSGGVLELNFCSITNNTAIRAGGGIEDASGGTDETLVNQSLIVGNTVANSPGNGGGIHVGGAGNLRVRFGEVRDNTAGSEGGGIWIGTGMLTVRTVLVTGNEAMGDDATNGGGGLYSDGGTIMVTPGSQIVNNRATGEAGSGGGILLAQGSGLSINDARVSGNSAVRAGGGIEDASGSGMTTFIINTVINDNTATGSMDSPANPGNGGGIHVGSGGNILIVRGSVSNNTAASEGGGLWNDTGTMRVNETLVNNNTAEGDSSTEGGGGIYNNGGTLRISPNTNISSNDATGIAGSGGGIFNALGGTLIVNDAIIVNNTAVRAGGGIEDASGGETLAFVINTRINRNTVVSDPEDGVLANPGNGGGIHVGGDGRLLIVRGTVNNNRAAAEGGGLWNGSGSMTVTDVVIDGNIASGDEATEGGGGIYNLAGNLLINPSTLIRNNVANGVSGSGGGIFNGAGGTLGVNDAVIVNNTANRAGGGIEDASGSASDFLVINSFINNNEAMMNPGNGGGIHVGGDGNLRIVRSRVNGNRAATEGGGLWSGSGNLTVDGGMLNGNIAAGDSSFHGGGAIFNVSGEVVVESGVMIINNDATGAGGSGGGILSDSGFVAVTNSTLRNNSASRAGGGVEIRDGDYFSNDVIYDENFAGSAPGNGGALHVTGMMGTIDITGGEITDNVANNQGGGLWNQSGTTMTVTDVDITGNMVTGTGSADNRIAGGGVYNRGGTLTIERSTVGGNMVPNGETAGGGIANAFGGTLNLNVSTVADNSAAAGGGIANNGAANLFYSTITQNTGTQSAGGFLQIEDPFDDSGFSVSANLTGTIVSGNTTDNPDDESNFRSLVFASVTSGGFNLIESDGADEFDGQSTDIEGQSALLTLLGSASNDAVVYAPDCGSLAIDGGDPSLQLEDQLGREVFNNRRDIGAIEVQGSCSSIVGSPQNSAASSTSQAVEHVSISPNPVMGRQMKVSLPSSYEGDVQLRIIDASGRTRELTTTSGVSSYKLDLDNYAVGTYFLQVINGEQVESLRFVVPQ